MARTTGNAKDLITFTRASTGTFLGSNGLLQTAAINTPRVEYDANGVAKGLLIEEARTNLLTYSEDFSNSYWVKPVGGQLGSAVVGPDGISGSGVTLEDNGATGTGLVYFFRTVTVNTSTTYTVSIFAKADQLQWLAIRLINFTTPPTPSAVWFNLNTGAKGTESNVTGNIEPYSNGWYRCSVTFTTDAIDTTGNIQFFCCDSDNDLTVDFDGTSSILVYGAQLEAGSFPTSYIPTSGATATRSADIASVSVSEFGYNQAQGSVVVEFEASRSLDSNAVLVNPSDGTTSNRMTLWGGTTSGTTLFVVNGGVAQATLVGGIPAPGAHKTAVAYATNDFALTLDAGAIQSDTTGTVPTVSQIDIGRYSADLPLNGHIKSINYYPLRLSDAKLQELTS